MGYALCKKPLLKLVFQKKPPALAGGVVTFLSGAYGKFLVESAEFHKEIRFGYQIINTDSGMADSN